jgi:hypothetical protein
MILHSEPRSGAMTEISISCDGRDSHSEFQEKVAASENSGAAAIWIANHLFQRDPISLAAMAAFCAAAGSAAEFRPSLSQLV